MTEDLTRLEDLLGQLLELDAKEQRARLLALQAAADPCLPMLQRLLAANRRGDDRLPTPPERGLLPAGFDPRGDGLQDPLLGRTLGDFTLLRCLGAGAMGRVYEATQGIPSRRVAVKVLASSILAGAGASQRFRREADLLGALDHPGICRIHSAGTAVLDGQHLWFLAMEYVDGERLDQASVARDPATKVALLAEVAEAVHYAHERGIVHRDLKPENILVTAATTTATNCPASSLARPRTKVLDFGVSLAVGHHEATSLRTQAGMVVGTLAYMSPEQFQGQRVDARSDIWGLGVILFELLVGRRPFPGHDTATLAAQLTGTNEAPRLGSVLPAANRDLEAVIGQALERDPQRRYRTAAAFAADLRRVLARQPVTARQLSTTYRALRLVRNHRRAAAIAAVALALVIAALCAVLHYARQAGAGNRQRHHAAYVAALQEAEAALRAEDVPGARRQLQQVPLQQRGYEWRHLAAASAYMAQLLRTGRPEDARFPIPFARRHDIAGTRFHLPFHGGHWPRDGRVDFVDLRTLAALASVPAIQQPPHRAAMTRDGRHAVFAGMPPHSTLQVHDLARGTLVASRDGFATEDNSLTLQPQGELLALAGESGTVRLFTLPDLVPRGELHLPGRITGIAFAPDGTRVAITHEPAGLSIVEVAGAHRRIDCDTRGGMPIYPTFADDGVRLAALNQRETNLNLWDSTTGRLLRRQPIPEHPMSLVGIPDNDRLAVGATDGSVGIFDFAVDETDSWMPLLTLREADQTVHTLVAAPDGTALLAGFADGTALLWQVPARAELPGEALPR